jgi:fatty acid desaturase
MYSLSAYSLHEGAAHQLIFPPRGPITRILNAFANNLCRLTGADPVYYAHSHAPHHAKFGTEMDSEFSNFVRSRRYLATLIPFAMFINFSDFIVHRPLYYTRSRALSEFTVVCYNLCLFCMMSGLFGLLFTSTTILVVFPYVALQLDRLRQFSEHNLMPLDSKHGARSFGPGFWGLLIGGGPWGQPCHWIHHLVPNIPWYQQILLHLHVAPILSKQQHKQWMLDPVIGYPRLLWHLLRKPDIVAR